MKNRLKALGCAAAVLAALFSAQLIGCGQFGVKEYTLQYTDESGTYQITVEAGMPYSIESIPQKTGYEFMGLYDSEEGGTQYVNKSGASVSPFADKTNIVLYPQFKAKEYTVILDYQGAAVTGVRSVAVSYDSEIKELPLNLAMENKVFTGWYTEPNRSGVQIADSYGVLPENRKVTEKTFDLSDPEGNIKLYAGFKGEEFTVTFYAADGAAPEEVKVEYGTPISEVKPATRVGGYGVIAWSKKRNDVAQEEIFTGNVTSEMILYAAELAPVIDFDSNGGSAVGYIVARVGSSVELPTPKKDLASFDGWVDKNGKKYGGVVSSMPSSGLELKAVWRAKLVFDSNGGSKTDDISVTAGSTITLPVPEKDGYIFAGWYTSDKQEYTATTMPSVGVALKAGWYKTKSELVTVINSTSYEEGRITKPSTSKLCYRFNYSHFFSEKKDVYVKIDWHVNMRTEDPSAQNCFAEFYSQKTISSAYLMHKHTFYSVTDSYKTYTFDTTFNINDDFYVCFYMTRFTVGNGAWDMMLKDFYYTVYYPDTAQLYL